MAQRPPQLGSLFRHDRYLRPFENEITRRYKVYQEYKDKIQQCGGEEHFTSGYRGFGIVVRNDNSIYCHEWAPGADQLALVGEFNHWNQEANKYWPAGDGKWSLTIPPRSDGSCAIDHGSVVKIAVTKNGKTLEKLSPWAKYVTRSTDSIVYHHIFNNPPDPYQFRHSRPSRPASFRIYEAHFGISSHEGKINTFRAFDDDVLDRIKRQGYNTIQLMAVMEHVYYSSFGYQATSFFAASSGCGTPDELKYLVDNAHSKGLFMLLDVVHSKKAENEWDASLFDYTQMETLRFMMSNHRWWIEEYNFDGFRFDGVTSMLYYSERDRSYKGYFDLNVDRPFLIYLMLANDYLHRKFPFIVTIAEEDSGMPTLCRPIAEGGQGFDYRLAMALPDIWSKILKNEQDEIKEIFITLDFLRNARGHVAYGVSHDQALVGDSGMALHKLIRLITMGLGVEAWLNFIGNECGHHECLFPREGNQESYHYCHRQFNLADDELQRFKYLHNFDRRMNELEEKTGWLHKGPASVSWMHMEDTVVYFERAGLVFILNFHPSQSFTNYKVGVDRPGTYRIALDSDSAEFGGRSRVDNTSRYPTLSEKYATLPNHLRVYIPCRTALVFQLE